MLLVQVGVDALHEGCLAGAGHAYADDRDWGLLCGRGGGGGHGGRCLDEAGGGLRGMSFDG